MLKESQMMVPDTLRRLEEIAEDLEGDLVAVILS